MADLQPITRPFPNGGLQLKQDAALLDMTRYSELTNMVSIQEGDLAIRSGNHKITALTTFASATAIHSIASLRIGPSVIATQATETMYVGEAGNIWAYMLGAPGSYVSVATSCAPTVNPGYYSRQSFSAASYSAGASGLPYEFFACPSRMLKDNGTMTSLQLWGILPPTQPPVTTLGSNTILPANEDMVAEVSGSSLDRLSAFGVGITVTAVAGTAPGNIVCTAPVIGVNQIQTGILMRVGSTPEIGQVVDVSGSQFTVNLTSTVTPTVGTTIACAQYPSPAGWPASFQYGTNVTLATITPSAGTINAGYGGSASNGFSTDDPLHMSILFFHLDEFTDARLRVMVNNSSADYYEYAILDSANLAASIANNNVQDNVWDELYVPKSSFTNVGLAGTVPYSWDQVTSFQVVYSTIPYTTLTPWADIGISSLYFSSASGPNSDPSGTLTTLFPYKYVATYRNPVTGAESNPSVEMIDAMAVSPVSQSVNLSLLGTSDIQITGPNSIAVYRSGGAFSDDYYRFVGYATNPGGGQYVTFQDHQSDASLLVANTADFDNDPPVTSSLPTPLIMKTSTSAPAGTATTLTVTVTSGNLALLRVGSNATVGINTSAQETAIVSAVNVTASTVTLFLQYAHPDAGAYPFTIEVDEVAGQPANLCLAAFDSMFVAGDPNNPHVLYKSKTGRPEAFPILNFASNIAQAINVGTPSNYIVNIAEYNGGVLCLNLNNIFYVRVASGVMETPIATPAQRGLLTKNAWCQTDDSIWYLSYDGIYSWSGGVSQWRSEDIDPLFRGLSVGPYSPVDLRPNLGNAGADVITMAYSANEVFISCQDTSGNPLRLRYHTAFNRWSVEYHTDPNIAPALCGVTAQFNEKTSGILYLAKNPANVAHLYAGNIGTSDGWSSAYSDGAAIPYSFVPAALTMGAPNVNKTFADISLEYSGLLVSATLSCFYDFAGMTTTPGDSFTFPATSGRTRAVVSLQNGYHKEAYAMQTRFSGSSVLPWFFYSMTVNVVPLTQIQVGRAYDWDDLGHPYDKRLYQLAMEYDIPLGQAVVINMDTMTGVIGAQQENEAVQSFTLSPPTSTTVGTPNRISANFSLNDNMIVKKVRMRPSVTTVPFKHFSYSFPEFTKYPADITRFTEWSDLGYAGDKVFRVLNLEMNSSGLPCVVQVQGDNGNLGSPITVATTLNDRARILTLESDLISKNTRLVLTPSDGGYAQYFKHSFDFWKEPYAVTHWDSYEFNFGYNGYNFVKQVWLEYTSPDPIVITFYVDDEVKFYSVTLPAHPYRDIERFYLPDSVVQP